MTRFSRDGVEVWVGVLPKLGSVIFDPRSQLAVAAHRVRLFVLSQNRMGTFARSVVSDRLEAGDEVPDEQFQVAAEAYLSLRRRETHCYKCKLDINSIDFAVCGSCRGIVCSCGACWCGPKGSIGEA